MLKIKILYWRSNIIYKLLKALRSITTKLSNEHTLLYNLILEEIGNYERWR